METTHLFVGECPSQTATANGWTWEDGRLAAAKLFSGLEAIGLHPREQLFTNLFFADGSAPDPESIDRIEAAILEGIPVVGMGRRVQAELSRLEIDHIPITHPAARGTIRGGDRYANHLRQQLG